MTTGNRIQDLRSTQYTNCGEASVGRYEQVTWSGADGRETENPFQKSIAARNEPLISWTYANQPDTWYRVGTVASCFGGTTVTFPSETDKSRAQTNSLMRVLDTLRQHDFSASVFLGELPESVRMVTGSCSAVLRAYQAVRRGRFGRAVKILRSALGGRNFHVDRSASSAWLSLRYGWIPLASDAYEGAEALRVIQNGRKTQTRVRGRSTVKTPQNQTGTVKAKTVRHTYRVQNVLKTDIQMSALESLGFSNPASLAWELLPGSFILDWVLDVGSFLELLFGLPSSISTRYITTKVERSLVQGPVTKTGYLIRQSDGYMHKDVTVTRTVSTAPKVPLPYFKNPFNGSLVRVLDMMALARSLS